MSDLFPVGSGEFLGEGGDGVLELKDTGVSLGQWVPQALELLRQTSEFSLCLFQLGLKETNDTDGKREGDVWEKNKRDTGFIDIQHVLNC